MIYRVELKIYDEFDETESNMLHAVQGENFADVWNKIVNYWGEDSIKEITARAITPDDILWADEKTAHGEALEDLLTLLETEAIW